MNWFRKNKTGKTDSPKAMTPTEFFKSSVIFLHEEAAKKGFANKGFILNEGLISIGNPFISAGLNNEPDKSKRTDSFYLSLATSNLQYGVVIARVLCTDRERLISGQFFKETADSIEQLYNELLVALKEDLHISFQEWEDFRNFIITKMLTLLNPYISLTNFEEYRVKAVSAYYLLGVSIGLEKYEP